MDEGVLTQSWLVINGLACTTVSFAKSRAGMAPHCHLVSIFWQ